MEGFRVTIDSSPTLPSALRESEFPIPTPIFGGNRIKTSEEVVNSVRKIGTCTQSNILNFQQLDSLVASDTVQWVHPHTVLVVGVCSSRKRRKEGTGVHLLVCGHGGRERGRGRHGKGGSHYCCGVLLFMYLCFVWFII